MFMLNLNVFDENGDIVKGLSVENCAPQQIQAVLMFLQSGWKFEVSCVEMPKVSKPSNT